MKRLGILFLLAASYVVGLRRTNCEERGAC